MGRVISAKLQRHGYGGSGPQSVQQQLGRGDESWAMGQEKGVRPGFLGLSEETQPGGFREITNNSLQPRREEKPVLPKCLQLFFNNETTGAILVTIDHILCAKHY